MIRRATILLVILLGLAPGGPAAAGGIRDLGDAWLIPGRRVGSLLGGRQTPPGHWYVSAAQGRLYDLAELPQVGLTAGGAWRGLAGQVGWQRLGRSLYREDQAFLEALVGHRWSGGLKVAVQRQDLGDGALTQAVTVDLRLRGCLPGDLRLDVWWPVTAAPVWYGTSGLRRWARLVGGGAGWAWALALDRPSEGAPTLQGALMLRVAPAVALGLRFEPWSGAAGLVTAWRLGAVVLRTSHLVHPDLGTCHRWSLDLGGAP